MIFPIPFPLLAEFKLGEFGDDFLRFHRDGDDLEKKVEDVARVAGFFEPKVRVIDDARILVDRDLIPLHHPLDRALAVHHVIVRRQRNAADRDAVVVEDATAVLQFPAVELSVAVLVHGTLLLRKAHLRDRVEGVLDRINRIDKI